MNENVARIRASICALAAAVIGLSTASADPILPYAQPIADKLTNDIAALEAEPNRTAEQERQLQADRAALNAYGRTSKNLGSDISILRDLQSLLEETSSYAPLLTDAVNGYIGDFQGRREALFIELLPAPLTKLKTNAFGRLNVISNRLHNASTNENRRTQLSHLDYVAFKLTSASNMVYRANRAPVGPTTVWARVGRLHFRATGKNVDWNTNIVEDGMFSMLATNRGPVERVFILHAGPIDTNVAGTYSLVEETNYIAEQTYPRKDGPFNFVTPPSTLTNVPNNGAVSIDGITEKYIVGRFNFTAVHTNGPIPGDTNDIPIATITNGFFQLNWKREK